jgi:UTP--glucose-1-phosphate uridylyltransferase
MSETDPFAPFAAKMAAEQVPDLAIEVFRRYYAELRSGADGLIAEREIEPVREVPDLVALPDPGPAGIEALRRTVLIKLNGGLATSMGMTRAKSLLEIKAGLSFLDVIAQQVQHLRATYDCPLPLILMNSFRTRDDSLEALAPHRLEVEGLPLDFLQHKVPRIGAEDLAPVVWPDQTEHEWCPPGHGDIYTALVTRGLLEELRSFGIRYAFVSNADNLGATVDLRIPAWMEAEAVPFAMEVTDRTAADSKGGHLALRAGDGQLLLREAAQCSAEDAAAFQDIERHRYFNTNNLWLDLDALHAELAARDQMLPLPMIRNEKPVDPRDAASPKTLQLETAMGAAIECFAGARALRVSRTRFAPVKTTNDLLAVASDAYELTSDHRIVRHAETSPDLAVDLDPAFFKRIDQFEARFADGPPSLRGCQRLRVRGDVHFGAAVVARGRAEVVAPAGEVLRIPDGEQLGD